jgi:HD-like signal output (HDOD) protein
MIRDTTILKRLAGIKEIPTLPEIMEEVLDAVASEASSAETLGAILSKDQALCSKVLKIANSAYFAQSRRVSEVGDAVVLLGFNSIAQLMLATSVFTVFGSMQKHKEFDVHGFWKHSLAVASASRPAARHWKARADKPFRRPVCAGIRAAQIGTSVRARG